MRSEKSEEVVASIRLNRTLWERVKIHAIKRHLKLYQLVGELLEKELNEHG